MNRKTFFSRMVAAIGAASVFPVLAKEAVTVVGSKTLKPTHPTASATTSDFIPRCAQCNKVVDGFIELPQIDTYRWAVVACHGQYQTIKVWSDYPNPFGVDALHIAVPEHDEYTQRLHAGDFTYLSNFILLYTFRYISKIEHLRCLAWRDHTLAAEELRRVLPNPRAPFEGLYPQREHQS